MAWTVEQCLREEPRLSRPDLDHLREWHKEQLHLPPMTDLELATFLHCNEYDLEKTKVCIDKYFTIRTGMPDVFGNRDVLLPENAEQEKFALFAELPQRDSNGNRIVALALQPVDDLSSMVSSRIAFMILAMMDTLIRNWPICPGYVFIMDASNLRFGHIFRTSISMLRKIVIYVQEAEPIRMKAVHIINMNYFGEKMLLFLKPFLGKELQKLLHFHSGAMEAFYEEFPRDVLPQEFGGSCGLLVDYHKKTLKMLAENREQLKKDEELQINESLRPGRKEKSSRTNSRHRENGDQKRRTKDENTLEDEETSLRVLL